MSTIKVDTLNEKSTNGNIAIIPTGSGKLVLDGLTWPHADGTAGQAIVTNASGVLSFAAGGGFTQGTEQATTSGTEKTFGSIPAGVDLIIVNFAGVSSGGTAGFELEIGDAGGLETSGYISTDFRLQGTEISGYEITDAFNIQGVTAAAAIMHGSITLALEDAANYTWCMTGQLSSNNKADNGHHVSAGSKSLSGELTQLKVTAKGDTFDAGAINIMYQ